VCVDGGVDARVIGTRSREVTTTVVAIGEGQLLLDLGECGAGTL